MKFIRTTFGALALFAVLATGCAAGDKGTAPPGGVEIVRMERKFVNNYLLLGERVVLVDTGVPGNEKRVLRALARRGKKPSDVALIVVTHGHADHAGSGAALREATGAPIAGGVGDAAMNRAGHNDRLQPTGAPGRRVMPFVVQEYPGYAPDIEVADTLDLRPYGVAGKVIVVPGHTSGSLAVVLDDGRALSGDLVRGRFGARTKPALHYFHADVDAAHRHLQRMIDSGVREIDPGHGHTLKADAVRRFLDEWLSDQSPGDRPWP